MLPVWYAESVKPSAPVSLVRKAMQGLWCQWAVVLSGDEVLFALGANLRHKVRPTSCVGIPSTSAFLKQPNHNGPALIDRNRP